MNEKTVSLWRQGHDPKFNGGRGRVYSIENHPVCPVCAAAKAETEEVFEDQLLTRAINADEPKLRVALVTAEKNLKDTLFDLSLPRNKPMTPKQQEKAEKALEKAKVALEKAKVAYEAVVAYPCRFCGQPTKNPWMRVEEANICLEVWTTRLVARFRGLASIQLPVAEAAAKRVGGEVRVAG